MAMLFIFTAHSRSFWIFKLNSFSKSVCFYWQQEQFMYLHFQRLAVNHIMSYSQPYYFRSASHNDAQVLTSIKSIYILGISQTKFTVASELFLLHSIKQSWTFIHFSCNLLMY